MTTHDLANWLQQNVTNWKKYQQQGVSEADTDSWIIRPLLIELGWNVHQPNHFRPQYPVGSERVDIALLNDDGQPVVLIEEKQISLDLDEEAERGTLDLEKYQRQLADSPCDLLVVTNGMKTWFLVRIASGSETEVRRCESATVDIGEAGPEDTTAIKDAATKLALLDRNELLSGRSLQWLRQSVELELAVEKVGNVLTSDVVIEAVAREANIEPDLASRAMEIVIGDDSDGGQTTIDPLMPGSQLDAPPSSKEIKLRRKMVQSTSEAKNFRKTASKFRRIWELFVSKEAVPKYLIHDLVAETVEFVKARGNFYQAYCYKSPLLVRIDHNGTQEPEDCYKINDYVRPQFSKMLQLMDEENNRR